MNKEEFTSYFLPYINHIYFINDCFTAYFSLIDSIEKHPEKINKACGFFRISEYCISKVLFIELAKIYSNAKDENTIQNLINKIRANQSIFTEKYFYFQEKQLNAKEFLCQIDSFFVKNSVVLKNLKSRRDKFLAHNDKEYFDGQRKAVDDFPISVEEIKMLINFLNDLANSISGTIQNVYYNFTTINSGDLISLIEEE